MTAEHIIIATPAVCCALGLFATALWAIGRRQADNFLVKAILSRRVAQIEAATEADLAAERKRRAAEHALQRFRRDHRPTVEIPAVSMAELVHGITPAVAAGCQTHKVRVERLHVSSLRQEALEMRQQALADVLEGNLKSAEAGYVCARLLSAVAAAQEAEHAAA